MNTFDLRPRSLGERLDAAMRLVMRSKATLLPVSILFGLVMSVVPILVQLRAIPAEAILVNGELMLPDQAAIDRYTNASLIATGVTLIAAWIGFGALYRAVASSYLGERESLGSCLAYGIRKAPAVMALLLMCVLIVCAPILLSAVVITVEETIGLIMLFMSIVVAIALAVRLSVALPAYVSEEIGLIAAIKRSLTLTGTKNASVFGTLLVGVILTVVVSIPLVLIAAGTASSSSSVTTWVVTSGVIEGLVSALISTPFLVALITVIYFDLRVRADGFDLEMLASSLGEGDAHPITDRGPYAQGGAQPGAYPEMAATTAATQPAPWASTPTLTDAGHDPNR